MIFNHQLFDLQSYRIKLDQIPHKPLSLVNQIKTVMTISTAVCNE